MKLDYKRTILIGLAFMSISSFWQIYDNVIPLLLKNTFDLGETITGGIMAADNVLALFLLPVFGALSDKVNTPVGKRMPFILVGTALAGTESEYKPAHSLRAGSGRFPNPRSIEYSAHPPAQRGCATCEDNRWHGSL